MTRITPQGPLEKPKTLHSRAIMDFARGQTCTMMIPGVCNYDHATTVAAHVPGMPKSQNSKGYDWFTVHACSACHDVLDGRASALTVMGRDMTNSVVFQRILTRAIHTTQSRLFAAGLLQIKGD